MKNITKSLIVVLALFFLQSCAATNGTKEPASLRQELSESDITSRCTAALELGRMKDEESIALLAEMADSENPQIRKCAIEGLRWYEDPGFCQDFYEYWLGDPDKEVRKAAGIAIVANKCEGNVTRRADYAMDSQSCGYTQYFINNVQKAIAEASPVEQWKEIIPKLNIRDTIVDKGAPEEILQMRLNLAFAVIDWGESVAIIHSFDNLGSLEENRQNNLVDIEVYAKKQEYIKQFCPIIQFPDFAYWNKVITGEKGQDNQ